MRRLLISKLARLALACRDAWVSSALGQIRLSNCDNAERRCWAFSCFSKDGEQGIL